MTVDIFQIAPPSVHAETITFGGSEIEIRPLKLAQLARIAQRYDAFRKVYFADEDAVFDREFRAAAMIEAYPAIIVAGTGKDGKPDSHLVEAHIAKFADEDISNVGRAIMRLTNAPEAPKTEEPGKDPLPGSGAGAADNASGQNASESTGSLPPSNS